MISHTYERAGCARSTHGPLTLEPNTSEKLNNQKRAATEIGPRQNQKRVCSTGHAQEGANRLPSGTQTCSARCGTSLLRCRQAHDETLDILMSFAPHTPHGAVRDGSVRQFIKENRTWGWRRGARVG